MKEVGLLILVGILVILKLIITGMCLAIGFKMGYAIIDKYSNSNKVAKDVSGT